MNIKKSLYSFWDINAEPWEPKNTLMRQLWRNGRLRVNFKDIHHFKLKLWFSTRSFYNLVFRQLQIFGFRFVRVRNSVERTCDPSLIILIMQGWAHRTLPNYCECLKLDNSWKAWKLIWLIRVIHAYFAEDQRFNTK